MLSQFIVCLFILLKNIFGRTKVFNFDDAQLIKFLYALCLWCMCKNSL